MEYPDLLRNLRTVRQARQMRQMELAGKLGISQGMLSRYEVGQAPIPTPLLLKWGSFLGLNLQIRAEEAA
mgnify:CR=1 FL=1